MALIKLEVGEKDTGTIIDLSTLPTRPGSSNYVHCAAQYKFNLLWKGIAH